MNVKNPAECLISDSLLDKHMYLFGSMRHVQLICIHSSAVLVWVAHLYIWLGKHTGRHFCI